MVVSTGLPFPLGATVRPDGVNFAVFAANAHALDLCLFDPAAPDRETHRVRFPKRTEGVWHVHVKGLAPDTPYALRAHGPRQLDAGHRYNPAKLLLDPYARAFTASVRGHPAQNGDTADGQPDRRDSAPVVPRCVIGDPGPFDWGNDAPPRVPWDRTVLYEAHVRGLTMRHPEVPEPLRGTYAGMASEPVLRHLLGIGVTSVQILPVHQHIEDLFLLEKGLSNYWGYQTIGFFAPHQAYAADPAPGAVIREFKQMVKAFHAAGLEVILDVVYNHTGEGGQGGACLVFRGLDNFIYYRLARHDRTRFLDFTGTGNTIDMRHPRALQMVLDSLRYWVTEMHVDGFRFDLAATLGRESDDYDPQGGFFRAVRQDPVLSTVKLIAEPWDPGWGGYQLGNFPEPFVELNGRYRDDVRKFWKGEGGAISDFAARLTGSEDIFGDGRRRPQRGINFITCHDGFTLRDLVSYDEKHNLENGEDNRDGESHNLSWNCGAEGTTADPAILDLRARQQRNLVATLFLSQGVPFLLGGDEISRSQGGNNNAYCQDNPISWFDWETRADRPDLRAFIRRLIALRVQEPVFRKRHFLHGNSLRGGTSRDVLWLAPDGRAMTDADWHDHGRKSLGMLLGGSARSSMSDWRRSRHGQTFLLLFHAGGAPVSFILPGEKACRWQPVLDTTGEEPFSVESSEALAGGASTALEPHSMRVYRLTAGSELQAQSLGRS